MEEAALEEFRAYAARRIGGQSPVAQALARKAARQYPLAVKALQRHGGADKRFWEAVGELSITLDTLKEGFPGDSSADYYFGARQWEELVMPALRAVRFPEPRGMPPLPAQISEVGDFVIHTHCEALSLEQQREGVRELCRILEQAAGAPAEYVAPVRFCVLSDVGKLVFMTTRRGRQVEDFDRLADPGLAAEVAQRGILKAAFTQTGDARCSPELFGPEERDMNELHIVQMAQVMVGSLLVTGDTFTAATVARWVAGQPALVRRLLGKLRWQARWPGDPEHAHMVLPPTRLVAQLACASPPLWEAVEAGGLRDLLERVMRALGDSSSLTEVKGWARVLFDIPEQERVHMATTWQNCSNQGMELGLAEAAAAKRASAAAWPAVDANAAGSSRGRGQQAGAGVGPPLTREQLRALPVRELKQRLAAAGVDYSTCVGKEELVDLLSEAMPAPPAATEGRGEAAPTAEAAAQNGGGGGEEALHAQQGQARAEEAARPTKRCVCCGAAKSEGVKLRICGGCQMPGLYFCSNACQRQVWPSHKSACREAQARLRQQEEEEEAA